MSFVYWPLTRHIELFAFTHGLTACKILINRPLITFCVLELMVWIEQNRTEAKRTALQKSRSVRVAPEPRNRYDEGNTTKTSSKSFWCDWFIFWHFEFFNLMCVCVYERQPHSTPEMSWYIAIIFEHICTLNTAYIKSKFTSNTHTFVFATQFAKRFSSQVFFYAFLTPSTSPPPPSRFEYIASQPVKSTHNPKHMFNELANGLYGVTKAFPILALFQLSVYCSVKVKTFNHRSKAPLFNESTFFCYFSIGKSGKFMRSDFFFIFSVWPKSIKDVRLFNLILLWLWLS